MQTNTKTILVIEDEYIYRRVMVDKLQEVGFNVLVARNGEDGLNMALKEHPDLIILDIMMPKMDGNQVLKKLREDSWGKNAHVIVLTVLEDMESLSESVANETYEYFVKSDIKIEYLVERIKLILNQLK